MVDVVFPLDEDDWGDTVRGTRGSRGGLVGWRGRHGWVTWAGRITLVAVFSGPSRRPFIKFGETARHVSRVPCGVLPSLRLFAALRRGATPWSVTWQTLYSPICTYDIYRI